MRVKQKQLLEKGGYATLATQSLKHEGFPFASVTPFAVDKSGSPIFLFSSMATHTRNLKANPRATLLVAEVNTGNDLGAARISVIGNVVPVSDNEVENGRASYLAKNPEARQWVSFGDFAFYKLNVVDIYVVAGFGSMGWVSAGDYQSADLD